jgi:hypothetical protein
VESNDNEEMKPTLYLARHWRLAVTLTAVVILGLMSAPRSHAEDDGFYGGRSLAAGVPPMGATDKAQLALQPGSVALGADAAHLGGERIFGGYRFGQGFALEGAHTRFGAPAATQGIETLSVAGVGSLPLTDSLTLVTRFGFHHPDASGPGNNLSSSDAGVLYGLGLSLQLAEDVELRARSEHLVRPPGSPQSGAADTFLFGANVRF